MMTINRPKGERENNTSNILLLIQVGEMLGRGVIFFCQQLEVSEENCTEQGLKKWWGLKRREGGRL